MGWSHKVWVWFWFLNLCRVHRCSQARLLFQRVKHQCSSLEQSQTFSKAQSYPKSLGFVLIHGWNDSEMLRAGNCCSWLLSSISWDKARENIPGAAATRNCLPERPRWERMGFIPASKHPGSEWINHKKENGWSSGQAKCWISRHCPPFSPPDWALQEHRERLITHLPQKQERIWCITQVLLKSENSLLIS